MNTKPISYKQTDPRWRDLPYQTDGETATIGGSGCGPTCAAMLIETLTGKTFTPTDACQWSMEHGYKARGQGTYYAYFKPQFAAFGIDCIQLNSASLYGNADHVVHRDAVDLLRDGGYLIACMGKGLWTNSGHFVVVWWSDEDTVYILDPASDKLERLRGDVDTFRQQVKYYWWVDGCGSKNGDTEYARFKQYMERYRAELAEKTASDWAAQLLEQAKAKGITDGTRPQDLATRQEVALMINANI